STSRMTAMFFFQAEDSIRDGHVTGVQTCALPISDPRRVLGGEAKEVNFEYFKKRVYTHTEIYPNGRMGNFNGDRVLEPMLQEVRSEERRVGKECRSRWMSNKTKRKKSRSCTSMAI